MMFAVICGLFIFNASASFATTGTVNASDIQVNSGVGKSNAMAVVLCNVLRFVTGGIGKTIASFIIIGVGIGFFTGKVSWGLLIGVTLGISAMFGAPAIIGAITGDSGFLSSMCDGGTGGGAGA